MGKIIFYIHNFIFLSYIVIFTPVFFIGASIIGIFDKSHRACHSFLKIWALLILKIARVKLDIEGQNNLARDENYVFACNHQSLLDIPIIAASVPHQIRWLAKRELFSIPFFGWGLRTVAIPVDRDKRTKKVDTIALAETLLKMESSVVVFPEGTRSVKGKLLPFKTGAAVIAIKSNKKIVPFTILNSSDIMPKGKKTVRPGLVKVIIGEPIATDDLSLKDKDKLIQKVRAVIENNIKSNLRL